jgi:hypothetical protein
VKEYERKIPREKGLKSGETPRERVKKESQKVQKTERQ